MPSCTIVKESKIKRTAKVVQLEGIFGLDSSETSTTTLDVNLDLPSNWNIGVVVGPSGCGKTTIANHFWNDSLVDSWCWDNDKSIVDCFPSHLGIKEIINLLSSVGFSSPPAWLRPFSRLSNGEQFRVNVARSLAEQQELCVIDEFTSVVDRTVAKIGSAAIQKAIRRLGRRVILVTCHYDVLDWLEPDWVYQPHLDKLYSGRSLHQRPNVNITIKRVDKSAWEMFKQHHYLDTSLNKTAHCYCAFVDDNPVAFAAVLHFPHASTNKLKRGHRTVCLPDYQGIGIGNALSDYIASVYVGAGYRFISQTSHPAMIRRRNNSKVWKMTRKPKYQTKLSSRSLDRIKNSWTFSRRSMASFEFVGAGIQSCFLN